MAFAVRSLRQLGGKLRTVEDTYFLCIIYWVLLRLHWRSDEELIGMIEERRKELHKILND